MTTQNDSSEEFTVQDLLVELAKLREILKECQDLANEGKQEK